MTRAAGHLWYLARGALHGKWRPLREWPRPGYCQCCGAWAWLTNETPAYSAYDGAYICEPCALLNDEDTAAAWAEYWSGCL